MLKFIACLALLSVASVNSYAKQAEAGNNRSKKSYSIDQLLDLETARISKLKPIEKRRELSNAEAVLRVEEFNMAQEKALHERNADSEMDYRTAVFTFQTASIQVDLLKTEVTDAVLLSEQAELVRQGILQGVGKEKKLAESYVNYWENKERWAQNLKRKAQVASEYYSFKYSRTKNLWSRDHASRTELEEDYKHYAMAKNLIASADSHIEIATINLINAKEDLKRFHSAQ